MEAAKFLSILKRQKYTLLAIPFLVMCIAFMLVRKLPRVYAAQGTLAAGLVDGSQPMSLGTNILQESKVSQQFSNLIQMMQMRKVYDQVSFQLILHDLTTGVPYKKPSKLFNSLNEYARKHAIDVYSEHYKNREPLSLWDADQKGLDEVIKSMGYGYEALTKKMKIYRIETSDFITVEYESDSATLSAFVVNTLCDEFMKYYFSLTRDNEVKSINYLDTLLGQKRDSLNNTMIALRNFKIDNHVLNLNEQATSLYKQMADFEARIEEVKKEIDGDKAALDNINRKFGSNDKEYNDKKLAAMNQGILVTKQQISILQDAYTRSNFDKKYEQQIDSLKEVLNDQIQQTNERPSNNPPAARANLMNQKLNLEVNLDIAQGSMKSLKDELARLDARFNDLVPSEAKIQAFEGNINVASQEYIEILKKYNQTSMAYRSSSQLKQIEMAMPEEALPSKNLLFVAISGVVSFLLCMLVLFILFYLDNSIQVVQELANKTKFPVLGYLPQIFNTSVLNINHLWEYGNIDTESREFKNQLRSVRFETDDVMEGCRILAITSLSDLEGKTFLAMSLASAYVMVNKRVLLIDGNFNDPAITKMAKPDEYIEDYLTGRCYMPRPGYNNDITILGNRGRDTSPFEINNETEVRDKINDLKTNFDMIIIESPSLVALNQSKEWVNLADKVIAVFESKKTITALENQYLAYLKSIGNKFAGWVLNKSNNEFAGTARKKKYFRKNRG